MDALETASLLFSFPDDIVISLMRATTSEVVLHIASRRPCATCPLCEQPSERVHGRYARTVADLPCSGRRVRLALTVRKFVCRTPACPRQIFTERLPDLVQSNARMTNRLREALLALGLATSAQVSERLVPSLGMQVSAPTLLRHLRTVACPPPSSVRMLGVDDWAWRKGQTYGTILVDLEKRSPIELLADRKEETLTAWLRTHPEIEVISRDRGGEYAAAAKKGAPQAQQIADKFHLVKNLREGLQGLMARRQKVLPEVEEIADGIPLHAQGNQPEKPWRSMSQEPRQACVGQMSIPSASEVSRANRVARYEAVQALHQQAISERAIARRLKLSRHTVHRFLTAESFPERRQLSYQGSLLDPYKPYILERWKAGCWNGSQLYAEAKARGYTGSQALFRLFMASLRKHQQAAGNATSLRLDTDGAKVESLADPAGKSCIKRRLSPARARLSVCQSLKHPGREATRAD
jgi:transposase